MYQIQIVQPELHHSPNGPCVVLRATYLNERSWFVVTHRSDQHLHVNLYGRGIFRADPHLFTYASEAEAERVFFQMLSLTFPHPPTTLPSPAGEIPGMIPVRLQATNLLLRSAILLKTADWQMLKRSPHLLVDAWGFRSFVARYGHPEAYRIQVFTMQVTLAPSDFSLTNSTMHPERITLTRVCDEATLRRLSHALLTDPELALAEIVLT